MSFGRLVARELRRAWTSGGVVTSMVFFILVAILFAFAIGPDRALLTRVGGGGLWTAALLAALLPIERLVAPDLEAGVIDQMRMRGMTDAVIAAAKIIAHWLAFGPALMTASIIAGGLLDLSSATLARIELGLLLGTPGLASLAVATAALTAGLRGGGAVAGLVMLPMAVPLLIFGAGVAEGGGSAKLLAAVSLLLVAGTPFVAGAAMRMGQD